MLLLKYCILLCLLKMIKLTTLSFSLFKISNNLYLISYLAIVLGILFVYTGTISLKLHETPHLQINPIKNIANYIYFAPPKGVPNIVLFLKNITYGCKVEMNLALPDISIRREKVDFKVEYIYGAIRISTYISGKKSHIKYFKYFILLDLNNTSTDFHG